MTEIMIAIALLCQYQRSLGDYQCQNQLARCVEKTRYLDTFEEAEISPGKKIRIEKHITNDNALLKCVAERK